MTHFYYIDIQSGICCSPDWQLWQQNTLKNHKGPKKGNSEIPVMVEKSEVCRPGVNVWDIIVLHPWPSVRSCLFRLSLCRGSVNSDRYFRKCRTFFCLERGIFSCYWEWWLSVNHVEEEARTWSELPFPLPFKIPPGRTRQWTLKELADQSLVAYWKVK